MAHTVNSSVAIASIPFLIRKVNVTAASTGADTVVHGGPAAEPDIVLPVTVGLGDTGEVSVTAKAETTITIDPETSGDVFDIYCIWFDQASGGITA